MKNGQKSSLYGETSLYSEEIPYSELFSKIHYIEYPLYCNIWSSASPHLMDPRGLKVTQTTYFSLLTHAKQLSLVRFCETTAGIQKNCLRSLWMVPMSIFEHKGCL